MSAQTTNSPLFPFSRAYQRGFSLVELMVVVAIMAILTGIAVPAISYISRSGSVNQAVSGISLSLAQARAYAMANNTYVWVGFHPDTTTQELTVGVVASTTGSSGDLALGNVSPVAKPHIYDHMKLDTAMPALTGMPTNGDDITKSKVTAFNQNVGGTSLPFPSVIQFSPEGEASIALPGTTSHWIQIGLRPIRGSNATDPNVAVFQVAGLTGQVQVFRP